MALSTVIFVGESKEWLPEIVEKARKLKCGPGLDAATEVSRPCNFALLTRFIVISLRSTLISKSSIIYVLVLLTSISLFQPHPTIKLY